MLLAGSECGRGLFVLLAGGVCAWRDLLLRLAGNRMVIGNGDQQLRFDHGGGFGAGHQGAVVEIDDGGKLFPVKLLQ